MKRRPAVVMAIVVASCAALAAPGGVRDAALRVYIHGMTAEIADQEVGRGGLRELLALLDDPAFPRRDNVVAFLAYLGGEESTRALVRMLDRPASGEAAIEDERALLLAPHALGRIAGRGERSALDALLALTAHEASLHGTALGPGIRAEAVAALALTGKAEARDRLAAIASGTIVPDRKHPELASRARAALEAGAATGAGPVAVDRFEAALVADPSTVSHAHGLTFINHVDATSPMTTSRLDDVLAEGTRRVATADFDDDVACCAIVRRTGSGGTFGAPGDGLDSVDDNAGLNAVIGQPGGRVKVVNVINFCGSAGTNIIGCSFSPGNGMVVARLTDLDFESVLWTHEYGHNIGLGHSADTRGIMFRGDNGMNTTLALAECAKFHAPSPSAAASVTNAGTCTDDGDAFADPIDNCPGVSNPGQIDTDGNGIGDACESGPILTDIDSSGRVDGFDLAILGRAFGALIGDARYDVRADLNHSGQIDGTDLALLARDFGK